MQTNNMNTKNRLKLPLLVAALGLAQVAPSAFAATTFNPINGFNPSTYFTTNPITAGIDFNDGAPTQSGFTGIAASNNKSYLVTSNGITFDIDVFNANNANQNRDRGASYGDLVRDFEQWYGTNQSAGVTVTLTMTGLVANSLYDVSFFTYNGGANQTTYSYYEGTSTLDPLLGSFKADGGIANFGTWRPGVILGGMNSGATGTISVTVSAPQFTAGANIDSRLEINGISVSMVPEPTSALAGLLGMAGILRRRRTH